MGVVSGNYWTDWNQDKRIDETAQQLAAERRARSRLSEQMRNQQGNLQGQIDRLTRALVALVEHEDIRAELGQYADAAACRRYAREVVSTVVVTGGAALRGSVEPADVPGYWLAAAARGVAAIAQGEARGEDLLVEARHRDPHRTALFLSLLGAQTRDARWGTGNLTSVLPDQPTVTAVQRQLWLAVADGRLAPTDIDAPAALAAALTQQVAAVGAPGVERVREWLTQEAATSPGELPTEQAAGQLNALRRVLTSGPRAATNGGSTASDATADHTAAESEDPLADCLRSLVDQGSPAEGDILDRMATVRVDLGFLDERSATMAADWSAPAGEVVDLLLADLRAPIDSSVALLALRVLTPTFAALADDLGRRSAEPAATSHQVHVGGETINVTATGATSAWQAPVSAGVAKRHPVNPLLVPIGVGLVIVGVVCLGLTFVARGFLVLAVAGILGGGGALFAALRERRDLQEAQVATARSTERSIEQASARLVSEQERSAAATRNAQEHLRAVKEALAVPQP